MLRLLEQLRDAGARAYLGEPVTVLEHSLQAATLAENEGCSVTLVVSALFHDIGWVLRGGPRAHELRGARHLEGHLPADVVEPIRLHVEAKRYLVGAEPGYAALLSDASIRTLAIQGGPMDEAQAESFLAGPHAVDAVALRRFDDRAKVPGAATPPLEHYAALVERLLLDQPA